MIPFWKSNERWTAYLKTAICLAIMFGGTGLAVYTNKLAGEVIDAMVSRNWDNVLRLIFMTVVVGLGSTAFSIASAASRNLLDLQWRTWMTRHLLDRWTGNHAFYDIERDGQLSNADQRIAEDVRSFTDQTIGLALGFASALVHGVSFGYILWTTAGSLEFEALGYQFAIPGYMVYLAFLYIGIQLWVTHWVGKVMVGLNNQKQTVEADYRYASMKVRENAEQIAFYKGGLFELGRLLMLFGRIRKNRVDIVVRESKVMLTQETCARFMDPTPTLALLPRYFSGELTLGQITQMTGAFTMFSGALSIFMQSYLGLTSWVAIGNRLRDLHWSLNKIEARQPAVALAKANEDAISVADLRLETPHGELLTVLGQQQFARGARWLIRGPSGTGKSTLLRAIAGLWPHGKGEIQIPDGASTMFLPQASYIPDGSLKAALTYPAEADKFTDAECLAALRSVGLADRATSLTESDRWQHRLSGGEQQRLAFARALLHRPDYLFLDEATSALDERSEAVIYQTMLSSLVGSTIVSVAHRSTLVQYHDNVLDLEPAPR